MGTLKNLVGTRVGRLVITSRAENDDNGVRWNCTCDCGKTVTISAHGLNQNSHRKKTRSCGCLQREASSKTARASRLQVSRSAPRDHVIQDDEL